MRITIAILALCMADLGTYCLAQQISHTHVSRGLDSMIDGSVHPELIPDSTAYRLYFIVASEMPDAIGEQRTRQLAHLGRVGLQANDLQRLITTLETFKLQYADLIAAYNAEAEALTAAGSKPDIDKFLLQRDGLVEATRDRVKRSLTKKGMALLDAHVQKEKSKMKVAAREGQ